MQSINLQITPGAVNPVINVSQNDVGRQFQLKLYDGAAAYTLPAGVTASVEGVKPDGTAFSYSDAVSVSGSTITVTTKLQMTVVAGRVTCEIRLKKSGLDIGSLNFVMIVEESPINENVDISETEIPAIIELAEGQVEDAEAWAKGTRNGQAVPSTDPAYHNNSKWYAEHVASSLGALSDVNISSVANGDVLEYNSTAGKWKNSNSLSQVKQALSDEVVTRAELGAHNLLRLSLGRIKKINTDGTWSGNAYTLYGVTFTVNDDLSVSVSGTNDGTGNANFYLERYYVSGAVVADNSTFAGKTVIMSGCPSGGSDKYYLRYLRYNGSGSVNDNGTGTSPIVCTPASEATGNTQITIVVADEYEISGTLLFKPMIRLATDADTTYRPYVPTNDELLSYRDNGVLGAKNLVDISSYAGTANFRGVSIYQGDADGSIVMNGTYNYENNNVSTIVDFTLPKGTYKLTDGGNLTLENWKGYCFQIYDIDNAVVIAQSLEPEDHSVTPYFYVPSDTFKLRLRVYAKASIASQNTLTNYMLYPMVRIANDSDESFAPFAMTNRELTEQAQEISGKYVRINYDSINVTADGVKTLQTLLSEMYAGFSAYLAANPDIYVQIDGFKISGAGIYAWPANTQKLYLTNGSAYSNYLFVHFTFSSTGIVFRQVSIGSATANNFLKKYDTDTGTMEDASQTVPASDTSYFLGFITYKKIS